MKKISTIIVTLLLLVTLVACNKNKLFAKVEGIKITTQEKTSFTFDIELIDPDEQLEGGLKVYVEFDGKPVSEKSLELKEDKSTLENVTFSNLEPNKTYTVIIKGTFNAKPVSLYKGTLSTQIEETQEIKTAQEFLDIFDNRNKDTYSKYKLVNDLDFTDVDTSKRTKTTFNSEFDGGGFTIKNYSTSKNERYMGLFSRILKGAHIHNLTVDNMEIETTTDLTGDRDVGILFGKSSSADVTVEDITITNSLVKISINSSSVNGQVSVGFLTGFAYGDYNNINIEGNNKLDLSVSKYSNVKVGGVFGYAKDSVKLSDAQVNGEIVINVEQDGKNIPYRTEKKELFNNHLMYVGGLIGYNESTYVKSIISNVNINYNETTLFVSHETNLTTFDTAIGGIYGHSAYAFRDGIYTGNIDITTGNYELTEIAEDESDEDDLEVVPIVKRNLFIGGITGYYLGYFTEFNQVARSNSNITITTLPDTVNLSANVLFGHVKFKAEYDAALTKFVTNGTINDSSNVINDKVFVDVASLKDFFENEWVLENIK